MSRVGGLMLLAGLFLMPIFNTEPGNAEVQGESAKEKPSGFAADRVEGQAAAAAQPKEKPITIDGKRAMKYLRDICAIGPRISSTKGMHKQQELIKKHFEDLGVKVAMQPFKAKQKSQPKEVDMANMIMSFSPEKQKRIIICSHYDTRPIADQEVDQRNWHEAFVSANDGGSGVALLMELAHHMKDITTPCGVDFVFFDGEEFIFKPKIDKYFFGSEHFAREWLKNKQKPAYAGAVLLDMIAGHGAKFPIEVNSWRRSEKLVREVWGIAGELNINAFQGQLGPEVLDDHIALQRAGIPAIDIIDFSYRHWHKLSDVPNNCSAASMELVAKVLSVWIQRDH